MNEEQEKPVLDNEKALRLARDAYIGSTNYFDTNIRRRIENDIRRFQSRFPGDSKYNSDAYRTRSRVFRPKTRATIRKSEAIAAEAFFTTLDLVNVIPTDEASDAQKAAADVMSQLLQYRLTKTIPWFQVCLGAYQDTQVTGVVISHQSWEYNPAKRKDRPSIDVVPVENFRFDPAAKWYDPIGTSPYLIHLLPMYVKDVKARMVSGRWKQLSDQEILTSINSYDTTRMEREENRTDSKREITAITDYTIVWVHRNIVEHDGEDLIFYTLSTEHVLSEPAPIQSEYAHGYRPYVIGQCVIETHKNYPGGPSNLGAPIQDEINEVTNLRLDNVKFVLNKRYFVKRNKQVDVRSLTRNVPGSVTLMTDPREDVFVQETGDVTSSSYNEHDRLNLDYDDISGSFSGSSVASNRKLNETVGGMNILTSNSNQVSAYQLKTFVETWVEPVLNQLMLLEQYYETDDVLLAMSASKAGLSGIDVIDDMLNQELMLTVNVGMGATNPADKVNTLALGMGTIRTVLADGLLEKYGLKPSEFIKEILGALGHRDGGRFFDFQDIEDPRIQGLMQQVEELQSQLEAKFPPELMAAQVGKLNAEAENLKAKKVQTGSQTQYSSMQAAQVVATMPQVAPIADELMKAAGYQSPTPEGVDPNFPQPATAIPEQVDFPANTSPAFPDPVGDGAMKGVETPEADGVIQ